MFKRDHHVRIATVLQSLDPEVLLTHGCYFGGGTAIVLSRGEYRESLDIDFLVSDKKGYRDLRHGLTEDRGLKPILRKGSQLTLARDLRSDQYGIRTMISVGGVEIKFEIVNEGRIDLETPGPSDRICGVATLSTLDMAASKLLANSDRWYDSSTYSRDLIDLAMLDLSSSLRNQAIQKASEAYGPSIKNDLCKAIDHLKTRPARLAECMASLKMDSIPRALLWQKIRPLKKGL